MVKSGLENFIKNVDRYKGRHAALIANQTSVTGGLEYSWNILKDNLDLKRIFSPEHGLFATEQDQVAVRVEPHTGCEIVSLYGGSYDSLIPDQLYLDDIDLVLFDIQDIGSRYYTFVNTMALFMKAIDNRDIEFLIFDRPNPICGTKIEGPLLHKEYESFVGIFNVSVRHGMTAAELAVMYSDIHNLNVNLKPVKMSGWKRDMYFGSTGLPWIPPSPNMPSEYTALVYPGMCLLEGTNMSEGRGTTVPFVNIGAAYINPAQYADVLNAMDLPGIYFRPVYFKPTFSKFTNNTAAGVYLHITDVNNFKPFLTGIAAVKAAFDLCGKSFGFLGGGYEFNYKYPPFDILTGSSKLREMIIAGASLDELSDSWKDDEKQFAEMRKRYLLYK